MKKLLAFLLILVCFSSLTACKEDPLDNVNTDSNNSSTQEQERQEENEILIQSFDGVWKEINIPEERDLTATRWFQIVIDKNTITVYWLEYYDQFRDHSKWESVWCFNSPNNPANGTWKNPIETVAEYSYLSKFKTGICVDGDGNQYDQIFEMTFTYKSGKLAMQRKDLAAPYSHMRDSDVIYFERISD